MVHIAILAIFSVPPKKTTTKQNISAHDAHCDFIALYMFHDT
jgi:hypothetical protein